MFAKNIILLFCFVCFVENHTSVSKLEKFKKYDGNGDGFISAEELQKLLFKEFNAFVTVRLAEQIISLTNLDTTNKLGFEKFEHMEPIIVILSKKGNLKENDEMDGNGTILVNEFKNKLSNFVEHGVVKKEEVSEILGLIGHEENNPIAKETLKDTIDMLLATAKVINSYEAFSSVDEDKNNILTIEELVKLIYSTRQDLATVENAMKYLKAHDKNNDGVLDFPEFANLLGNPIDIFKYMFKTTHITREQLNEYFYKLNGHPLEIFELDEIDPLNKNNISYKDIEEYVAIKQVK